jgi:hypothetical protein
MTRALPQNWRDLVAEFRENPLGRHSADLQELLNWFRAAPIPGKHFLYMIEQHRKWALARFSPQGPHIFDVDYQMEFDTIEDAEHYVFRLRFEQHFGLDPYGDQS